MQPLFRFITSPTVFYKASSNHIAFNSQENSQDFKSYAGGHHNLNMFLMIYTNSPDIFLCGLSFMQASFQTPVISKGSVNQKSNFFYQMIIHSNMKYEQTKRRDVVFIQKYEYKVQTTILTNFLNQHFFSVTINFLSHSWLHHIPPPKNKLILRPSNFIIGTHHSKIGLQINNIEDKVDV